MFDGAQWLQRFKAVARNVNVLEVLILLQAVDGNELLVLDGEAEEGVAPIVERLADLVQAFFDDLRVHLVLFPRQLHL